MSEESTSKRCGWFYPRSRAESRRMMGLGLGLQIPILVFVLLGIFVPRYLNNEMETGISQNESLDSLDSLSFGVFQDNGEYPLKQGIYILNITNVEEVLKGEKPMLKEIGPFNYHVYRTAVDYMWSNDRSEIQWKYYTRYMFQWEGSIMDHEAMMTTLNVPIWAMIKILKSTNQEVLLNSVFDAGFPEDKTIIDAVERQREREKRIGFTTRSVKEVIFGYSDPFLEQFGEVYKGFITNYTSITDTRKNVLPDTMKTGYPNINEVRQYVRSMDEDFVYQVDAAKNRKPVWGDKSYAMVEGSDGGAFKHPIDSSTYKVFVPSFYRPVDIEFKEKLVHLYLPVHKYIVSPKIWEHSARNPINARYNQLVYNGVLNVSVCAQGLPMVISRPRYAGVEETQKNQVDIQYQYNSKLDVDSNESYFIIEPRTGMTMAVSSATQVAIMPEPFVLTVPNDDPWLQNHNTNLIEEIEALEILPKVLSFSPEKNQMKQTHEKGITVKKMRHALQSMSEYDTEKKNTTKVKGDDDIILPFFKDMKEHYIPLFHAVQTVSIGAQSAKEMNDLFGTIDKVINTMPIVTYTIAGVIFLVAVFFIFRARIGYKMHPSDHPMYPSSDNIDGNFELDEHDLHETYSSHSKGRSNSYDDIEVFADDMQLAGSLETDMTVLEENVGI